jgi:electron transfer flavoprotein alpha subunit
VLVVAETRDGQVTALTRDLLGLARSIARDLDGGIAVAVLATDVALARDLARFADRVHFVRVATDEYEGEVWLPELERLARAVDPAVILLSHSESGADLGPRLAFRMDAGIATACLAASVTGRKLSTTRACYGGNVREEVSVGTRPALATVKSGVGKPGTARAEPGEVVEIEPAAAAPRFRVVARQRESERGARLEDARIVVAGGRGLEGPDGFVVLVDLARTLGGVVGASRVPCDLGWCPHSWQIGLTGKTVSPELYFAIGISGAGHHMAGCGNAGAIVAINTDPEAAIFKSARYGIVGDYRKAVPALAEAIARLDRQST